MVYIFNRSNYRILNKQTKVKNFEHTIQRKDENITGTIQFKTALRPTKGKQLIPKFLCCKQNNQMQFIWACTKLQKNCGVTCMTWKIRVYAYLVLNLCAFLISITSP